ncbi:MAG: ATP-binding cassette domain-containing protein, partial [Candidatus Micrarchaeota archaeon]|nr:ATP-binding cassette domain-containing protein [Candidatus Micrarchaeota archaeon]
KSIYKIPDHVYEENLKYFAKNLGISKLLKQPVRKLSLGERMKCEIANAFLHNPKLVFLDEPTIGLDVLSKDSVRSFLRKINKERKTTIILTTHDMKDISELCERVILINEGRIIYDGTLSDLERKYYSKRKIRILFSASYPKIEEFSADGVLHVEKNGKEYLLVVELKKIKLKEFVQKILSKYKVADFHVEGIELAEIIKEIYRK